MVDSQGFPGRLGRYLCEVRAGQFWRLENLGSFDGFLDRRFPESRRKACYLMAIHEHLTRIPKKGLKHVGWTKAAKGERNTNLFACEPQPTHRTYRSGIWSGCFQLGSIRRLPSSGGRESAGASSRIARHLAPVARADPRVRISCGVLHVQRDSRRPPRIRAAGRLIRREFWNGISENRGSTKQTLVSCNVE